MVEIIYLIVTAILLFGLFRRNPFRHGGLLPWLKVAGVVLLAAPGAISLVFLVSPWFAGDPFASHSSVWIPTVVEDDPALARAFLVRGVHVVEGNETAPVDYLQAILPTGGRHAFNLLDGSTLQVGIQSGTVRKALEPGRPKLVFAWSAAQAIRSGSAVLTPVQERDLPATHEAWLEELPMDLAPLGSLLQDAHRYSRIHFFVTPLADRSAVRTESGPRWWQDRSPTVIGHVRMGMETKQKVVSLQSGKTSFMKVVAPSGLLLLFLGVVSFLMVSPHWVRTCAVSILYCLLYVGALDSFALRLHRAGLNVGGVESRARAVVETAGTRMHPVTAARSLLDVAAEDQDEGVRLGALHCLGRIRLAQALTTVDGALDRLETLTRSDSADIGLAAGRILKQCRKVPETR